MSAPVDTVLFDIDDTLCAYRRSGADVLTAAFEATGVEPFFGIEDYYDRYSAFVDRTDTIHELRTACFAALADERGRDPDHGRAVAAAYADERDHRAVDALPGAREAVDRLGADHRLGVVTNGAPGMQAEKLAAIGLDDAFEVVVHAGYDAPAKPDPAPFHHALDALDTDPDSTVHVGNSLTSDVPGAQAAGLRAAWLADGSTPDPVPAYTLDSMTALHEPPWQTR
ncbi:MULTISPECIES: HAD family hydrolase [Halococcus]|uniref:HAD-superfamily hydrolase, subfamily IA, variant 1 n=1 Tax=Halococcus salifodinae DSM 8989 TaxID=1227456 RepID=M0MYM9_9EURY|nr:MULTISPECIES: HAD family hydrolase [Halococcus]EMA49964.1 HAD-superfamily hydrolase, subfamily IA, variant 1 [Halococcus salifodinae DSM 8989]